MDAVPVAVLLVDEFLCLVWVDDEDTCGTLVAGPGTAAPTADAVEVEVVEVTVAAEAELDWEAEVDAEAPAAGADDDAG